MRQRIVDAYRAGEGSIRQLAKRFKVSPDCVRRLLKRVRETGSIHPLPRGGNTPAKLTPAHLEVLQTLVEDDNDATLAQLAQRLEQTTQLKVSSSTISRDLSQLNITRKKKSLKASKAYTDEVQQQRREYWEDMAAIKVSDLVFLDETGFNRAMVEQDARSLKGHRAYGEKPAKGRNVSLLIGAMTLVAGFTAGFSFEGGTNGDTFFWYIEQVLVPTLWPGAVVVMDNLSAHKVEGVKEAIERVGARVVYLSPYSPDFNPIENLWSKLKQYVRRAETTTKEKLHDAIQAGLENISLEDVHNWFCHCCYCA
ncbi:MAG: IS630 family transposase [Cyanobacteria bacterium P01_F01_bin.150]